MRALVFFFATYFATAALAQQPATHQLKAGPKTVVWGYYSASAPPVLRVRSGDTVEVRIQAIRLAIPYSYNGFRPGSGFLPDEFPYSRIKIVPLDRDRMLAHFS